MAQFKRNTVKGTPISLLKLPSVANACAFQVFTSTPSSARTVVSAASCRSPQSWDQTEAGSSQLSMPDGVDQTGKPALARLCTAARSHAAPAPPRQ
jgi:hypothetical protein